MVNNRQSASKLLSDYMSYEESSTTIPRKGSTVLHILEKADIKIYNLEDQLPKKEVIYAIINTVNFKVYIGSALNIHLRLRRHLYNLKNNIHHSSKLQRSFNKYGETVFKVIIIEETCERYIREQEWINKVRPDLYGYNILNIVRECKAFKLTSEQVKKAIQKSSLSVIRFNKKGEFIKEYSSISEAAKEVGDQSTNISSCCKGKLNFVKNSVFIYSKDYDSNKNYSVKEREYVFSDAHKKNISEKLKGRSISMESRKASAITQGTTIYKCDIEGVIVEKFDSFKQAYREKGLDRRALQKSIKNKTSWRGYLYKVDEDIV